MAPRRARWRTLLAASDRALGAFLAEEALSLRARRAQLARWAALAGLPEAEVVASPFGARMIALGLEVGATTVHHELRPLVPWHPAFLPEGSVVDPLHGAWHRGALRTGKYQEFCQEDPFCSYHPEHSSKWAPHEFLHRAVGFFSTKGASGFERYLGARLNELLPVATWYGLEEALRLEHEGVFDRAREGREPGASLDRARWLTEPEAQLRRRARAAAPLLRWTLERTRSELDAIDRELESGTVIPSGDAGTESFPLVRLDASSDALAYVQAHAARLSSECVTRVLGALAHARLEDVGALRARVDRTLDRLLFAPLRLDARATEARILAAKPHDLFLRVATQGDEALAACAPLLARARRLQQRPSASPRDHLALAEQLERALRPVLGARRASETVTLGLVGPARSVSTRALTRGLAEVLPATSARLGRRRAAVVEAVIETAPQASRRPLAERVAAVLVPRALAELAMLEGALATASGVEPRAGWAEPLGALRAQVVARDGRWSIRRFATDVIAAHRGEALAERPTVLALARLEEDLALVSLSPDLAEVLDALGPDVWPLARFVGAVGGLEVARSLAESGLVLTYSTPRVARAHR